MKNKSGQNTNNTVLGSRTLKKKIRRHIHTAVQVSILFVVAGVLYFGRIDTDSSETSRVSTLGSTNATIDEVSSADIAASIARSADLVVADNVTNLADSLDAQVEFATAENAYLNKPQLVPTDSPTRADIITYVVQEGESLSDVASQFNVTTNTIRWANDITGNTVSPGRKLTIPPVSGLIYVVQSGDTAESLAKEYDSNAAQIVAFNDAEISGLRVGQKIIIPGGKEPAPAPTTYFTSSPTSFSFGSQPLYGGNGYSYGYCTWHVANRRAQIGRPIPRNLGNAVTWASLASQSGLSVSGTPRAGSVLWHKNTYIAGGLGHVGFVEKVNPNGSILVSDMNYPVWNGVTTRTIQPNEFGNYSFIF